MGIKLEALVTLLLGQLMLFAFVAGAPAQSKVEQHNKVAVQNDTSPNFEYLGTIDGKAFFVEPNLEKTWKDAKVVCESSGLKLASIDNQNQADFLIRALTPYGTVARRYWTSGHESLTPSMLVWDGTDNHPEESFAPRWSWPSPYSPLHYCVAVGFWYEQFGFHIQDCEAEYFTFNILCQP